MRRMRATLVESGIESGSMMSHDEASELLPFAALHAVDAETLAAIEETPPPVRAVRANWIATAPSPQRSATRWRNCPRGCGRISPATVGSQR